MANIYRVADWSVALEKTTTPIITVGAITEGDSLVAVITHDGTALITSGDPGWSLFASDNTAAITVEVWHKTATATEPASYSWIGPSEEYCIWLLEYRDFDFANALVSFENGSDALPVSLRELNVTSFCKDMVSFCGFGVDGDSTPLNLGALGDRTVNLQSSTGSGSCGFAGEAITASYAGTYWRDSAWNILNPYSASGYTRLGVGMEISSDGLSLVVTGFRDISGLTGWGLLYTRTSTANAWVEHSFIPDISAGAGDGELYGLNVTMSGDSLHLLIGPSSRYNITAGNHPGYFSRANITSAFTRNTSLDFKPTDVFSVYGMVMSDDGLRLLANVKETEFSKHSVREYTRASTAVAFSTVSLYTVIPVEGNDNIVGTSISANKSDFKTVVVAYGLGTSDLIRYKIFTRPSVGATNNWVKSRDFESNEVTYLYATYLKTSLSRDGKLLFTMTVNSSRDTFFRIWSRETLNADFTYNNLYGRGTGSDNRYSSIAYESQTNKCYVGEDDESWADSGWISECRFKTVLGVADSSTIASADQWTTIHYTGHADYPNVFSPYSAGGVSFGGTASYGMVHNAVGGRDPQPQIVNITTVNSGTEEWTTIPVPLPASQSPSNCVILVITRPYVNVLTHTDGEFEFVGAGDGSQNSNRIEIWKNIVPITAKTYYFYATLARGTIVDAYELDLYNYSTISFTPKFKTAYGSPATTDLISAGVDEINLVISGASVYAAYLADETELDTRLSLLTQEYAFAADARYINYVSGYTFNIGGIPAYSSPTPEHVWTTFVLDIEHITTYSGGLVFGGVATTSIARNVLPTSGVFFTGIADTALIQSGEIVYEVFPTGGTLFSGAAVTEYIFGFTGIGGVSFSGEAGVLLSIDHLPSAGVLLSGQALCEYYPVPPYVKLYSDALHGTLDFGYFGGYEYTYSGSGSETMIGAPPNAIAHDVFQYTIVDEVAESAPVTVDIWILSTVKTYTVVPEGGVLLSGEAIIPRIYPDYNNPYTPSDGVIFGGAALVPYFWYVFPTGGISLSGQLPSVENLLKPYITVYTVVLTGAPDGVPDFSFILKSYSGTHYSALTSHLNFRFPRQAGDIQAIIDRPNGEIILYRNGAEVLRGLQSNYDHFTGSTATTFTISATYNKVEDTPKTVASDVEEITFDYDGKRTFKVPGFLDFQPLDSLDYKGEIIPILQVTMSIAVKNTFLKLKEA